MAPVRLILEHGIYNRDFSQQRTSDRNDMAMIDRDRTYTAKELAELVSQHDQEHPDHRGECDCYNGIIRILRTFFTPTKRPLPIEPRPYVPPDLMGTLRQVNGSVKKPWLRQRDGETKEKYNWRISHSCYNCGTVISDRTVLNAHEDSCPAQGRRGD